MHGGEIIRAQWHFLWPNITFNVEPGPQNISVDVWVPDGTGRTVGFTEHFFAPDVSDETADELMTFTHQVGREDGALVEAVQRGMASGAVPFGRLMPESEQLVAHFQRMVRRASRRLRKSRTGAATCSGSGSHHRWSCPGSSRSSAPAIRSARKRPCSTGQTRSSVRWRTSVGASMAASRSRTSRPARRTSMVRTPAGVSAARLELRHHAAKPSSPSALGANSGRSASVPQCAAARSANCATTAGGTPIG